MEIQPGCTSLTLHEAAAIQNIMVPFKRLVIWQTIESATETWLQQMAQLDFENNDLEPIKVPFKDEHLDEVRDVINLVITHAAEKTAAAEVAFRDFQVAGFGNHDDFVDYLRRQLIVTDSPTEAKPDSIQLVANIAETIKSYRQP